MSEGNAAVSARELVKPGVFGMRSARYVTDLVSEHGGLLAALAALIAISVLFAPRFASAANILDILRQMAFTGIIGLGMTLVIIAGEIDISVGSAVAFASALFGVVAVNWGWPFPVAAVGVLLATTVIGLCAGAVRAIFGVPSFIVTLALFSALKGGALLLTDAIPIPIRDDNLNWWGTGAFVGLPVPALILAILFVIFSVIANRTSFGRSVYTIGGNAEAAYLSGVPVAAVRAVLFGPPAFSRAFRDCCKPRASPPEMPGWASVSNSRSSLRSSSEGRACSEARARCSGPCSAACSSRCSTTQWFSSA